MASNIRIRHQARTLPQILHDREDEGFAEQMRAVFASRKLARVLADSLKARGLSPALLPVWSVRVHEDRAVVLVQSAAVLRRLRQIQPSLERDAAKSGFLLPLQLQVLPSRPEIGRAPVRVPDPPRGPSESGARALEAAARRMEPGRLREETQRLARTLAGDAAGR